LSVPLRSLCECWLAICSLAAGSAFCKVRIA
jgi:hypothetical protein